VPQIYAVNQGMARQSLSMFPSKERSSFGVPKTYGFCNYMEYRVMVSGVGDFERSPFLSIKFLNSEYQELYLEEKGE